MNRRSFLRSAAGLGALGRAFEIARPPNIIVILADNLGYGDLGCYGSTLNRTPHSDRMAREGMRFTDCYSASGVCTPARAALMTGCYPRRVGLHFTRPDGQVLHPVSHNGLNPDEMTIARLLKSAGYATSMIGKWHLGDQAPFLPTRQGFDYYLGIPYSDDMVGGRRRGSEVTPPLPLMENEHVIEAPVDRDTLTRRYTEKCIEILEQQRGRPFFVYLPHAMPGSTSSPFSSERFRGKSANGAYGDSIEELDWSVGEILSTLKRLDLDSNTLVIWTSDNGAPRIAAPHGSNRPLGGWGYTTAEGGQRIPFVARWPGKIPAGSTCSALVTLMDLFPTAAQLARVAPPRDRPIDGKDIWPLLSGRSKASPHEAFYYYAGARLEAVRSGKWKLVFGRTPADGGSATILYDLEKDVGETTDVAAANAAVVRRLQALAEKARVELGDGERKGRGERPAGWVADAKPQLM